jgi:hypothetical protein
MWMHPLSIILHPAAEGNTSINRKEEKNTILFLCPISVSYRTYLLSILVDYEGGEAVHSLGVTQLPKQSINHPCAIFINQLTKIIHFFKVKFKY